ncbi:MAG: HNH endonuclease [Chloroflexota bacterium]|nr:HNH endonuclease [Chloroflexota bacterium]
MPYLDPERRREYGREWMRRNPQQARDAMRRWRRRHPDKHNAAGRDYYARHKERLAPYFAAYIRAHRELRQAISARRRSRELAAEGDYTTEEWMALLKAHGFRCTYCGTDGPLEPDHRVPLARGGTNYIENILPACRRCNTRKRLLTEDEFRARLASEDREGG